MMPDELERIASEEAESNKRYRFRINVCVAAGCISTGSEKVKEALEAEVEKRGLGEECLVKGVGCMGPCAMGPVLAVEPDSIIYEGVKPEDAAELIDSLGKEPVARLYARSEAPFFSRQVKIALENAGRIDPERIEDYIKAGGYSALAKAVTEMSPGEVIGEINASGLRGRGGAGYPTGLKWSTVQKAPGNRKFVVCNGDEGDPGAFMDRSILESDPHRIIEGLAIAAYAVGADRGFLYVRAEYPLAVKRLRSAIRQATRRGLLGDGICNTDFSLQLEIRLGAGAFVCGEETALMASIEGRRGTPRPRPPYPANFGLWGCPTCINNVETLASVPNIIRNGGSWYAGIGAAKSKGTKVFALAGRVVNTGLIEVPMGISLRDIIFEIGGGIPDGRKFKAVQTGGPSGGCIPEKHLDMPVDYESLREVGSIMGSGGMIVMDSTSCMVDVAKYFMDFCRSESCGKCVPCRVGTAQMHRLLCRITDGEADMKDLEMLQDLCDLTMSCSLCGLGQTAPNPVLSTLRYFRDEYIAHIEGKTCPAGVCKFKNVGRQ